MAKSITDPLFSLKQLLVDPVMSGGHHPGIFGAALSAALVLNRFVNRSASGDKGADAAFMNDIKSGLLDSDDILRALGYFEADSPLGKVTECIEMTDKQLHQKELGIQDRILGRFSGDRKEDDLHSVRRDGAVTNALLVCKFISELIMKDKLDRKTFLNLVNCVILLEESHLIGMESKGRRSDHLRKVAIEYALMRFLGSLQDAAFSTVDEMKEVFALLGDAARLNREISDGLDAVRTYCKKAARDPDQQEVAVAVGRPFPLRLADIAAAASQARMFRDGQLRKPRAAEPTCRSRFSRKSPD